MTKIKKYEINLNLNIKIFQSYTFLQQLVIIIVAETKSVYATDYPQPHNL